MTYLELLQEEAVLTGEVEKLSGDVTGLSGDVSGLSGDVSDLRGDVTGLRGDVTDFHRGDYGVYESLVFIAIQHAYEAGEIEIE